MQEKKTLTALIELATVALALYAQQSPATRAEFFLAMTKASRWTAERFGRLALKAEAAYQREVQP